MRSLERGAEPDWAERRLGDATDLPVVLRLVPQIGKVVEDNLRYAGDEHSHPRGDRPGFGRARVPTDHVEVRPAPGSALAARRLSAACSTTAAQDERRTFSRSLVISASSASGPP